MENKRTFYLGLAYPNALIFGLIFLFIGLAGLTHIILRFHLTSILSILFIQLPIFLLPLSIGLLSFSIKILKVDPSKKELSIGTLYCFLIFKGEIIGFNKIAKLKVVHSRGSYSAGGNFLYTAKSSFSVNETAIFLYTHSGEKLAKLEKLSDHKIEFLTSFFSKNLNIEVINKT